MHHIYAYIPASQMHSPKSSSTLFQSTVASVNPSQARLTTLVSSSRSKLVTPAAQRHWTLWIGSLQALSRSFIHLTLAHGASLWVTIIALLIIARLRVLPQLTAFVQRLVSEYAKRMHEEKLPTCKTPVVRDA